MRSTDCIPTKYDPIKEIPGEQIKKGGRVNLITAYHSALLRYTVLNTAIEGDLDDGLKEQLKDRYNFNIKGLDEKTLIKYKNSLELLINQKTSEVFSDDIEVEELAEKVNKRVSGLEGLREAIEMEKSQKV